MTGAGSALCRKRASLSKRSELYVTLWDGEELAHRRTTEIAVVVVVVARDVLQEAKTVHISSVMDVKSTRGLSTLQSTTFGCVTGNYDFRAREIFAD